MNEVFVCRSSRMAAFLIRNDCRCFKTALDDFNTNYLVHLFDKDDKFKIAIEKWNNEEASKVKRTK